MPKISVIVPTYNRASLLPRTIKSVLNQTFQDFELIIIGDGLWNQIKHDIKQIYVATIKPGYVRGNHYHLKRIEQFFIAAGEAEISLEDIKTKKKIHLKVSSKNPKVVTIFPKIAHAVKNIGKETVYLVSVQNNIYNPQKPDTITWEVR